MRRRFSRSSIVACAITLIPGRAWASLFARALSNCTAERFALQIGRVGARYFALSFHARKDASATTHAFAAGKLRVDLSRRQVLVEGREVHLTPIEYRMVTTLIRNAGKVLTHRQLLQEVWGPDCTHETHYLRVYVNQLRRKLGDTTTKPSLLQTKPGIGYRFG